MTTELKVIAGLAAIIGFLAVLFFGGRAIYDAGDKAGANRIQLAWDADNVIHQKAADRQIEQLTKDKEEAIAYNETVRDDLQKKLASADSNAADLLSRVHAYQTRLATISSAVPQTSNNKGPTTPSGITGSETILDEHLATYDSACQRDSARLNALIAEVSRQL